MHAVPEMIAITTHTHILAGVVICVDPPPRTLCVIANRTNTNTETRARTLTLSTHLFIFIKRNHLATASLSVVGHIIHETKHLKHALHTNLTYKAT